jgi:hypothetical protein
MDGPEMLLVARRCTKADSSLEEATRQVERYFWGSHGVFARRAFDYINAAYFGGRLPWTLLVWGITVHARCLGFTRSRGGEPPVITLHPSILGGTEKADPWGVSPRLLGECYAFDVVLHECIHVAVNYLLGGREGGDSSHNDPRWVAEVNRVAPLLGFDGVEAGMKKPTRVRTEGGSKVQRVNTGNVPYDAVSRFPHGLRRFLGRLEFYERKRLPWEN